MPVAISTTSVANITAPINIEYLKFSMLSTILPNRPALQEIPATASQPRNDTKFCEFCERTVVLRAANQDKMIAGGNHSKIHRWNCKAVTEGENDYPSVKNQRFLPAPLTRGAKAACGGRLRDKLKFEITSQRRIDMNINKFLDVNPEVAEAIANGKPVVALESTIISHGMPYPQNVETALQVERIIRENGAVPATIAIIGGRLKAGLTAEEIEYFGKKGQAIHKASRRDLAVLCARGEDGATTVTTTMIIAHMAGIKIFATGGIGGVHRGAETTMDISADLEELGQTPVMVVCAGAKSILDLGLTLEYLETKGVPVIGYGTEELPAFYTRQSGFGVDYRIDTPAELAAAFKAGHEMGLKSGMLVTNPIPEEYAMPKEVIDKAIEQAICECNEKGIKGKETTPFLLARVAELTGGDSLASNIRLVFNNAKVAAQTAVEYCK